jgi:hypothetical protein
MLLTWQHYFDHHNVEAMSEQLTIINVKQPFQVAIKLESLIYQGDKQYQN